MLEHLWQEGERVISKHTRVSRRCRSEVGSKCKSSSISSYENGGHATIWLSGKNTEIVKV